MTWTSKHFIRQEFACHCGCGFDVVDVELLNILEDLRDTYHNAVIVHCGCRCWRRNVDVGGADKSQHLYGKAADIHVEGYEHFEVYRYLQRKYPNQFGMKLYPWGIHIDVRSIMWRG